MHRRTFGGLIRTTPLTLNYHSANCARPTSLHIKAHKQQFATCNEWLSVSLVSRKSYSRFWFAMCIHSIFTLACELNYFIFVRRFFVFLFSCEMTQKISHFPLSHRIGANVSAWVKYWHVQCPLPFTQHKQKNAHNTNSVWDITYYLICHCNRVIVALKLNAECECEREIKWHWERAAIRGRRDYFFSIPPNWDGYLRQTHKGPMSAINFKSSPNCHPNHTEETTFDMQSLFHEWDTVRETIGE